MKYRFLAILLCVAMTVCLTACGGGDEKEEISTESAVAVSNNHLDVDSTVIAVGKTKVAYNEYKAYYYFMKNSYESVIGEGIWNYTKAIAGDKSLGQEAVEAVLRLIIQVKIINREAAAQKVELATDEKEEAAHNAKTLCDSLSEEVKTANGLDVKTLTRMLEENKLTQKMYNIEIGKVNANLTPEQIKVAKVQLIYLKANDKNREQVKQKAEQLHQSLVSSATGFYAAAKQHTEADEIETMIGGSDSRTQLKQAVIGLQEGQISPVVAEKDGYYLARCIQADSPELEQEYRNEVVQQKQIDAFQKVYKKWSQKYEVKVSKALLVRE